MNIMRKIRGGGASVSPSEDPNSNSQHTALGLMHLKKLFSEYSHPPSPLSDKDKDDKLYNMLPLFCKVFGNSPSSDMMEKFRDVAAFCTQVSKLMVTEMRRRASNQSTSAAACAIVKFLEIENSEESSNGWMLLSALNLLAAGDSSLVQVMTAVSVPSTLVKCLYLFFDLPEMEDAELAETDSEFTPIERRILLQKIFVQVLVRLCGHSTPADELSRKDDLSLLFSAVTSWCPPHNAMWRKSAAEVLMTLSRHGLTPSVVSYIHNKGCVALCVDNMQRAQDLSPLEVVEMFVAVFCFLKDSSEVGQTLLDDFRVCQGYGFLADFLLKLEIEPSGGEAQEATRNLVLMLASLATCGFVELRPASVGSLFHIAGFTMPQPSARGGSVRNLHAFNVLQSVFLKSSSEPLCSTILDAISSVYHSDNANYFILEGQNTLSQFAERIHLKPPAIQLKFFQLLEFVVFQLNFVPCKELISLSLLLKGETSVEASILCTQTLLNILRFNVVFKDVYREVGILEVLVTCLTRYAALLKDKQAADDDGNPYELPRPSERLGGAVTETLTALLSGSAANAAVFRESGGAKCAHSLVLLLDSRQQALGIVRELILCSGGDEDMATLLGLMHSAPPSALILKEHILKAVLGCLRESHRPRTAFRKVGGFVYLMSVLVSMEGGLSAHPPPPWDVTPLAHIHSLLHLVFNVVTVAMRFEPANAKFFQQEICESSLCDTLRLLGCFSSNQALDQCDDLIQHKDEDAFHALFTGNILQPNIPDDIPTELCHATIVMRLLYDLALDSFEKQAPTAAISFKSPSHIRHLSTDSSRVSLDSPSGRRSVSSLNLSPPTPDPVVVHSGAVSAMFHLLPSLPLPAHPASLTLQAYLAEVFKSLVRSERNQQVMCEAGLPARLLSCGKVALEEETHPLHPPLQYMLERLSAQALEPSDLREFLRLGQPLCCVPMDSLEHRLGGPVPLTRVKTLVSMTTPRDFHSSAQPPFVEFDMSAEGFGCLYLPSVAPQSWALGVAALAADANVLGGIGAGDRMFPPPTGLTFSTWICVERFSDPRTDPHCVRLLTLVRNVGSGSRDEHLICLSAVLSARDKAIIVSTQETVMPQNVGEWEPEGVGDSGVRVWCPDLLQEGQWHHMCFVLNRAVLKNSSLSVFLDGQHILTQKLHYISQNPGGGAANLTVASSVYGFVGTPPPWRRYSRLAWKQGPCHLLEEALGPQVVATLHQLGPHYMGCLQAAELNGTEPLPPLLAEDKVVFGLNAKAVSQLTLAKIRKAYSRTDNKSIARQLGMSAHENATPIRVLHNAAGHLAGPARSLGGVVVGYLGVRVFSPRPVARTVEDVGGCSVLLGLIAMASDVESLYAAVKALVCVVRSNRLAQLEMDRSRSYQTLAMLLRKKRPLLNSHILHLTFTLVGTVDSSRESSSIPNATSFKDLLCDVEVWHEAPGELQRSLFEHLYELVAESSEKRTNLRIVRDLQLVSRLLLIVPEVIVGPTRQVLFNLLAVLLGGQPRPSDLLMFGQFIAATLPSSTSPGETAVRLSEVDAEEAADIVLRNRCLQLVHSLLFTQRNTVCQPYCEALTQALGLDWVLLFMQRHVHSTTAVWGLRLLVALCSCPPIALRFREGTNNGAWLADTRAVAKNKMAAALGYQLGGKVLLPRETRPDFLLVPGFQRLSWLLPQRIEVPEVYFLLVALTLGQPVRLLPADSKLDLDNVWNFMFGVPASHPVSTVAGRVALCPDAVVALLAMVRAMLNQEGKRPDSLPTWLTDYPVTIIQFLFFLYHNMADLMPAFMGGEILTALAGTLFPRTAPSEPTTPSIDYKGSITPRSPARDDALSEHPARKFVMDFLRVIVVDSLSLAVSQKGPPVIDIVLDAFPDSASAGQTQRYQTEVLAALMDHLLAADVLIGEQAALPVVPGGGAQFIAPNVCYLAARLVDKLWQGTFSKEPHEVFDFVVKLISQAKRRPSQFPLESLQHCLNRTTLFLLSRPTESIAEQMAVLEVLHKLTTHRGLMFGSGNHELDFIACLTYCLLQLTADMKIMLEPNARTTWHVSPTQDDSDEGLSARQGHNLMAVAAKRVWDELYVCKKPAIEEVFKTTLACGNGGRVPELSAVREQLFDSAHRTWLGYVDLERKAQYRPPFELHTQIQSKIQKVTGGLTRLASRTKVKKEETMRVRCSQFTLQEVAQWTVTQVALVRALVEQRAAHHHTDMAHMQRHVLEQWLSTETELTRERGLWGPMEPSRLDKWMLDMTEGPCRMRKKMLKNELFYVHYPFRPELHSGDNRALKYKVASSWDSKEFYEKYRPQSLLDRERDPILETQLPSEEVAHDPAAASNEKDNADPDISHGFSGVKCVRKGVSRTVSEPDGGDDDADADTAAAEDSEPVADSQTMVRLLERQEKISHMFRCARIQGLDTTEGLLLFGKEHFYVMDGYTVLRSRVIRDIESLAGTGHEPILPSPGSPSRARATRQCSKFAYEDIREVHKRRYLLQPMALEVFSTDGRNHLLAFQRKVRNKVYQRFLASATAIADSAQSSVAGQKRTANVEQGAGLLSNLIGDTSVTQRWVRGEISNFQYLMHLNTLAGRSYNDLMQYPVFPWILADYDSAELDLTRPETFRDFSKPMGAQSPDRLHQFKKRYKEWDDPHGETPPYHYGTHYSSAMIVCSYLVRMEPFTQHFLRLQGGHFDLADRMFNSIREAWQSASKHNMADVKELIPEFFYLPEFVNNSNNFDLGCKQSGVQLGDVVLPPWAKEDPREFIRVHRAALECDYVSQHLHEWIDLIFGCKQNGQAAVDATNVFHHLFYEGNVDIYTIDDPLKKNATIGFINNFGQIPKQLFKKPHPCKKQTGPRMSTGDSGLSTSGLCLATADRLFFHNLDNLRPSLQPIKELKGPVGQIVHWDKCVLAAEQNKVLLPPSHSRYVAWGYADHSLRVGCYDGDRAVLVCETLAQAQGQVIACVAAGPKTVVTAGTSSVVTIWELSGEALSIKQCLYGHTEAVTCLAASPAYSLLVSGSRDQTAIVWDLSRRLFVRQLRGHCAPVAAVAVNELTGDIATCAGTWLHVWTVNGDELARVNTRVGRADRMQQILCAAFSQASEWDAQNVVVTGSTDGVARMWSVDYVQVPKEEKPLSPEPEEVPAPTAPAVPEEGSQRARDLVKQMSMSADFTVSETGLLAKTKSGSESSLSEEESKEGKEGKENAEGQPEEKERCSDSEGKDDGNGVDTLAIGKKDLRRQSAVFSSGESPVVMRRKSSIRINPQHRKSEADSMLAAELTAQAISMEPALRPSKSDTSLSDSFVLVDAEDVEDKDSNTTKRRNPLCELRDGFKWQRQLVFRSKLTMHTAYDRKDNAAPASITALAVSKDHRTVYVGDARGRVFSWSVADQPGRPADHWLKDDTADCCVGCATRFTLYERRHHCRSCGQLFCSRCSRYESEISRLRILKPVRVCQGCHAALKQASQNDGNT